ncbi:MAG: hypothetical protein ACK4OF_01855 [Aquificaceae bacterium]
MCDFEALHYSLRDELLNLYKEADSPQPRFKITSLKSGKICGLANLAKLILYFERVKDCSNSLDKYDKSCYNIPAGENQAGLPQVLREVTPVEIPLTAEQGEISGLRVKCR